MVKLRQMRLDEFPEYCNYFIADYSKEIVQNYGHSIKTAIELAKKDLATSFPNGLEFTKHELLCIESSIKKETKVIGYLWHSLRLNEKSTFIYDFIIFSNFRNKGFGKQTIAELELRLKVVGIEQIKLRVAFQNKRALKLYEEIGFTITGYNMFKNILE